MVPVALAWLGVFASVLLVVLLPGQLAGLVKGPVLNFMWLPALVFEVTLALWLIVKGAAMPATRATAG
jgi:ABC-type xylose transport system permease subunit